MTVTDLSISTYRGIEPNPERIIGGRSVSKLMPPSEYRADACPGLVTVVTVCFNAASTLERTINSVAAQTWSALEYLVIDGGSTDGTIDLLRRRSDVIDRWISEPDKGISDAFNKGIASASGEFVILVHADDWLDPEHLATAVKALSKSGADFAFGDLVYHDTQGRVMYTIHGDADYARCIDHVMPALNHPTVVVRRSAYERNGLFDMSRRLAMDYDWFLRLHRNGGRGIYVPGLRSHMTLEGASDRYFVRAYDEVRAISVLYGASPALAWLRFHYRVNKSRVRIWLQAILPQKLYHRLRQKLNSKYGRSTDVDCA